MYVRSYNMCSIKDLCDVCKKSLILWGKRGMKKVGLNSGQIQPEVQQKKACKGGSFPEVPYYSTKANRMEKFYGKGSQADLSVLSNDRLLHISTLTSKSDWRPF